MEDQFPPNYNGGGEEELVQSVNSLGEEERTVISKRPLSRRHSFSYLDFKPGERKKKLKRRASFNTKALPKIIKEENPCIVTESAETALALKILNLVRMYPNFVRDISDFVFHQKIGQGGFGEVWLANDLRTGKKVAIKELYADQLCGRNLSNFIREIVTMAKVNSRFVIPFVGYTIEKPYCIITEYVPCGSLHQLLLADPKATQISGTLLTMIAIGICVSIKHIHAAHILHRDIKAANVLLDHNYLPKLCDFGIARFIARDRSMTQGIGTASHMAPEILKGTKYGMKIDVFAYGMTLYEMVERKSVFRGKKMEQITQMIMDGVRPKFKKPNTPKCLIELITDCWNQRIKKRPTVGEIYKRFANGSVYFAGTDPEVIKKFIAMIEEDGKCKNTNRFKKPVVNIDKIQERLFREMRYWAAQDRIKIAAHIPLNEVFVDTPTAIIRTEEEKEEYMIKEKKNEIKKLHELKMDVPSLQLINGNIDEIISNPKDPRFKNVIIEICDAISTERFSAFLSVLTQDLLDTNDDETIISIIDCLTSLIEKKTVFIEIMYKNHFFSVLPTNNMARCISVIHFVAVVFKKAPNTVDSTMFRTLAGLFKTLPAQTVSLFNTFVTNYYNIKDPTPVLDYLLLYARKFINVIAGVEFIDIVYNLMKNTEFAAERRENMMQIVSAYCRSNNVDVSVEAVKIFTEFYDKEKDAIPFDALIKLCSHQEGIDCAISLMLRAEKYPVSRTFFRAIVDKGIMKPKISRVILKFAAQQNETAIIVANNTKWMKAINLTSYKTMLLLFKNPETQQRIIRSSNFPPMLSKMLKAFPDETLESMPHILRRSDITQNFIDKLNAAQFFKSLLDLLIEIDISEYKAIRSLILAFETCVYHGYCSYYSKFFDILARCIETPGPQVKLAAHAFITLSSHKKLAAKLKNCPGLVDFFTKLQKSHHSISKDASVFISNINQV